MQMEQHKQEGVMTRNWLSDNGCPAASRRATYRSLGPRDRDRAASDCRQEPGGRPSFPICLLSKLRPERLDRRQAEFVEHDAKSGLIDSVSVLHAASPAQNVSIRAS